jgi:hypothetical protein
MRINCLNYKNQRKWANRKLIPIGTKLIYEGQCANIVLLCFAQEKLDQEIPPTLAELSKDKKYYAVLNLIRRVLPVVPIEEFTEKIDGKAAAEWAERDGRKDVANELRYRFNTRVFGPTQVSV